MQPGQILDLTDADIATLQDRFGNELQDALVPHAQKEEQLAEWQRGYNGEPSSKKKTFPFSGACNVVIPLIGIAVDSIVARVINTIFSPTPLWTVTPLTKSVPYLQAKSAERFLDWSQGAEFDMYGETRKWAIEVVKFGWSYLKVFWTLERIPGFRFDTKGKAFRADQIVSKAVVKHVLLQDIVNQAGVEDDDDAEWIAQRFRLTDTQLRWREYEGHYPNVDDIIKDKEDISEAQFRLTEQGGPGGEEKHPINQPLNQLYEIWADVHVPKYKIPSLPAQLTFHLPTKKLLRAVHAPYFGQRPFVKGKFIELEGRREGFGIARRLWQLQESITTIHRQGVDNGTIANTRAFLTRRGAIRSGTRIWPGRMISCADPEKDIKPLAMGEVGPSNHALELSELAFSERASGISDPQLGRESNVLGSRATATGTLAIIQEGNRRFDLNIRDARQALSTVGRILLQLNQQFRTRGFAYAVQGPTEGEFTEQTLDMPQEFIRNRLGVQLTASTSTINRDIERQGLMGLLTVLDRYYERMVRNALIAGNEQAPEVVRSSAVKSNEGMLLLVKRIVERFDVRDIDPLVPSLAEELENAANTRGGAAPAAEGAQALGGMESFPGLSGNAPQGGAGGAS